VNIALSADGTGISQIFRNFFNYLDEIRFRLLLGGIFFKLLKVMIGQNRTMPGTKILGSEILAGNSFKIGVYVS
jgi:hypothetical protein